MRSSNKIYNKKLKRVNGEVQLASLKTDLGRPPTAGSHLKRCSNDHHLRFNYDPHQFSSNESDEASGEGDACLQENITTSLYDPVGYEEKSSQEERASSLETSTSKLKVPNNTANSIAPNNEYIPVSFDRLSHRSSGEPSPQSYSETVYSTGAEMVVPQSMPTFFHSQRTSLLSSRLTISDGRRNQPVIVERFNAVITTATTLGLPGTVRGFPNGTPSPVWSLRNEIGSAELESSPLPPTSKSSSSKVEDNSSRSKQGDGDTVTSCSPATTAMPSAPPASPAMSGSDRAPFMLTFRKPKPPPRSRITSTRGSGRQHSLPTTASTPNPISQPTTETNNSEPEVADVAVVVADLNNNAEGLAKDINNEELNNNDEAEAEEVKECEERERSLLSILEKPLPDQEEPNEVIAQKVEVMSEKEKDNNDAVVKWTSDTSSDSKDKKGSSTSESGSSSLGSEYPESSSVVSASEKESEKSKQDCCPPPAANAFLTTTEKGAIRFHLPGRIQHKTTIKVAHFPVGEDKNIVVNVKPDNDDEDECAPCGVNNQNFCMPPGMEQMCGYPCPPSGYPYPYPSPYGYPPPAAPPYYYGYPPYY